MRARRDLSFAGKRVHSIRLLDENGSMGRVVCELLSTQICGPAVFTVKYPAKLCPLSKQVGHG
jgi:hypothetical protein